MTLENESIYSVVCLKVERFHFFCLLKGMLRVAVSMHTCVETIERRFEMHKCNSWSGYEDLYLWQTNLLK
jgi:hypothetical protein